jgi:hypothetical protein
MAVSIRVGQELKDARDLALGDDDFRIIRVYVEANLEEVFDRILY